MWGRRDTLMEGETLVTYAEGIRLLRRLGPPSVGLELAIRFKNPYHLFLFPLAHDAWLIGYLRAWLLTGNEKGDNEKAE